MTSLLTIALSPEVEGELVPVEGNDRNQDEEENGNQLGNGRNDVDEGRLFYPFQHEGMNEPQTNGRAENGG